MPNINDSSDEAEFEEEEVTAPESRKRRASRGTVSYNDDYIDSTEEEEEEEEDDSEDDDDDSEEEDDDSDEDDIPLAALKSPAPAKKKKAAAKKTNKKSKAKTTPAKKKKVTKKMSATKSNSASSSNSSTANNADYSSPSFALYGTESIKGKLIQNLLCRWWYAITWPDPSAVPKVPPTNYDAMDGFPGVYICTQGEEVGTIKRFRDKENTPCFNNFCKKSSEELKGLLVKAINEQKRQLVESEGGGTTTEKNLNTMLKWATKINAKKADTEAAKVLKANKLSIPE
mmetsp:Transcript_22616/g.45945  ORF Transcript_22616/g.45945 Transcript_22616/m.45945 type:complete len:286 (+) Transcript_22616:125-982(+)